MQAEYGKHNTVSNSWSSLYRLPRFINCPTYITLIREKQLVARQAGHVSYVTRKLLRMIGLSAA